MGVVVGADVDEVGDRATTALVVEVATQRGTVHGRIKIKRAGGTITAREVMIRRWPELVGRASLCTRESRPYSCAVILALVIHGRQIYNK